MKTLSTVFKKQITEYLSSFKHEKKNKNVLGAIMFGVLSVFAVALVVPVFSQFIEKYLSVRMNNVLDIKARQFEFMTVAFEFAFLSSVISATSQLQHILFEDDDRLIYSTMPIHPAAIFVPKIAFVYIREAIICTFFIAPVIIVFALQAHLSAYFIITSIFVALTMPIISTATAAIFCIPAYYIKKLFHSKYTLILIFSTLFIGVLFFAYTKVLDFASHMITTNDMKFFFSERIMNTIIFVTSKLYPAKIFASIVLKIDALKFLLIFIALVIVLSALGLLTVSLLYSKAIHLKEKTKPKTFKTIIKLKPVKSTYFNLLKKEFVEILRTPSYALEYFSVAIIAPLMVYSCIELGAELLSILVFVERNFELSLFVILIFTCLTNTFASTSISRDGVNFMLLKTMPIRPREYVGTKVLFASIVMCFSVVCSLIIVSVLHFVTFLEALYIGFVTIALGYAQICLAINRDLTHPKFPKDSSNEVKETNITVSVVILIGLVTSLIVGGIPLLNSTILAVRGLSRDYLSYLFPALIAMGMLAFAVYSLHKDIEKRIDDIHQGGRS